MTENKEARLWARIGIAHATINWLADEEARAAWVNGAAADGRFLPEKEKLIDQAEANLEELASRWRNA